TKGRFGAWVRTVTDNTWKDYCKRMSKRPAATGDTAMQQVLEAREAPKDLYEALAEPFDRELVEIAQELVRARVGTHVWRAFQLTAVEGRSGDEAAKQLDISAGVVRAYKSRVLRMLQDEVAKLK